MTDIMTLGIEACHCHTATTKPNRQLRRAQKEERLILPSQFMELSIEEIEYIDGCGQVPISGISFAVEMGLGLLALVCPATAPFVSVATLGLGSIGKNILRLIGKKALAKALTFVITGVAGFLGIGGYFLPQSTALTIASVFMGCTGGLVGALGLAIDACDNKIDGWFRW